MSAGSRGRLVAVVGPTASGKSALALRLARALDAEIISCDSLQVYRGLDIGSAKPTPEERAQVPHHLVDVADPDETFSAARYSELARAALHAIAGRGRLALVVGGSGLYLRALLVGLFEGPSRNPSLRRRLEALAERRGDARLHRLLGRVDAPAAARIHPHDRLRVVRALEVYQATRRPLSDHLAVPDRPLEGFAALTVGIDRPREQLRQRVEERTAQMFAAGLLDEVATMLSRGYGPELRPLRAIGYRQAVRVLQGCLTAEAARHDIVVETMRYAKRQMTWFRNQVEVRWAASAVAEADVYRWLGREGRPG